MNLNQMNLSQIAEDEPESIAGLRLLKMNLNRTCQGYRTGVDQKVVIYSIQCRIGTLLQEQGTAGKETSDACPCLPQVSR